MISPYSHGASLPHDLLFFKAGELALVHLHYADKVPVNTLQEYGVSSLEVENTERHYNEKREKRLLEDLQAQSVIVSLTSFGTSKRTFGLTPKG